MKIEKAECSYQLTECDLKFGKQITLDRELLVPISVLDKIRKEIEEIETHDCIYIDSLCIADYRQVQCRNENKEIHSVIDGNFFKGI